MDWGIALGALSLITGIIFYWRGKKAQSHANRILTNIEFDTKEIKNDVIPTMSNVINTLIDPERLKILVKDPSSLETNEITDLLNGWKKIGESFQQSTVYLKMTASWVKLFGEMLLKISNNELIMDTEFNSSIKSILKMFDPMIVDIENQIEKDKNFLTSSGLSEEYKNNEKLKKYFEEHYKINQ